ncbi:MAG: AarF/ABC1/UbiB kinase family protein [Acidimicrobiia bacterium]|nr:AarF/ABC1/UbiB kinase family protein [Acidimicrobiia bacterium]
MSRVRVTPSAGATFRSIETTPADLAVGAFSATPPWLVDPDDLPWRRGLDGVRARTRAGLGALTTPPRFPPLRRGLRVISSVGWALTVWYFRERGTDQSRAGVSARLRKSFERLGSTYIKLGQIVSGGDGLFPDELVGEFKLLRDRVPAESFASVRAIVETDLGRPLDAVFSSFAEEPLAAASIAQVHAARLVTGEDVVVKVQRPTVARRVRQDLRALAWLGPRMVGRIPVAALANPPALVELFAETIVEELDFRLEAENMLDVAAAMAKIGIRETVVPRPHPRLVTRRVLVMERLSGYNFDDAEGMHAAGIDTNALLRAGLISFLEGALVYGVFHGDLHGGNLFVMSDGRTALLDFGITGRLDQRKRQALLQLLVLGSTGDVRGQLAALRDLGAFPADTDLDAVVVDLGLDRPVKDPTLMSADELVGELRDLTKKLLEYGARAPKELMLFVKNMMFLDGATATLAPDLDILGEIAHVYLYFQAQYGDQIAQDLGLAAAPDLDLASVKASLGVGPEWGDSLTYAEVRERRELIRSRMQARQRRRR